MSYCYLHMTLQWQLRTNLLTSSDQVQLQNYLITVKPLLSGHLRGMARWPLNRGGRLIEVCQIWTRICSNVLYIYFKTVLITKVINR